MTCHEKQSCYFVNLKYKQWVIDHRCVKPGHFLLFRRYDTDDISNEQRNKTVNEIKQMNSRILVNNTLRDFLTKRDRETYNCLLVLSNPTNSGRKYYGYSSRYTNSRESCNFFAWLDKIEHNIYQKCKCGKLCKKIDLNKKDLLPHYKLVCVDDSNKYHSGCNIFEDA